MPERTRGRIDDVTGFLEGSADDDAKAALVNRLKADPQATAQLGRQALMHGILGAAASKPLDPAVVLAKAGLLPSPVEQGVMGYVQANPYATRPPPRRKPWAWVTALGWLTAAGAIISLILGRQTTPVDTVASQSIETAAPEPRLPLPLVTESSIPAPVPVGRISYASGGATWVTGARPTAFAKAGSSLQSGDGLVTVGPTAQLSVTLPDGTRLDAGGDAVIGPFVRSAASEPPRIFISRGTIHLAAGTESGIGLRLESPHGWLLLGRARLRMQVSDESTRVDVAAGRIRFEPRSGRNVLELAQGQYAQTVVGAAGSIDTVVSGTRAERRALLVAGPKRLGPSDTVIVRHLEALGFAVNAATPATLDLSHAHDSTLVVISSSVAPQDLDPRIKDLPVPVMTWEVGLYPILGMTGRCEEGECGFQLQPPLSLEIKDAAHPMAAGLTGTVKVPSIDKIAWGAPSLTAAWIVTITDRPTQAAIFAYDRGAAMPGLTAPARRVGFFFHDATPENQTGDAVAWKLFDAAVLWCLD